MTKKFEVSFNGVAKISPCHVYISPSENPSGYFNVSIHYVKSSTSVPGPIPGRTHEFAQEQNLLESEQEAIEWATIWLAEKAQLLATLKPVEN